MFVSLAAIGCPSFCKDTIEISKISRKAVKNVELGRKHVIYHIKIFVLVEKKKYLCRRYPEYNLFTLKGLIPVS